MIAFVDPDLCIGCTQCAGLCPAVFHMEGVLAVAEPGPIPPEEVPQAVDAANACPVSAIRTEACKRSRSVGAAPGGTASFPSHSFVLYYRM